MTSAADPWLAHEARVLTRYLLDRDCPPELVERYVKGSVARHIPDPEPRDRRIAQFAVRHPRTLPLLDAAAAITGAAPLLRAKLQLMSAVVETSTHFASEFFPRPVSRPAALLRLVGYGMSTAVKALVGIPLLYLLGATAS